MLGGPLDGRSGVAHRCRSPGDPTAAARRGPTTPLRRSRTAGCRVPIRPSRRDTCSWGPHHPRTSSYRWARVTAAALRGLTPPRGTTIGPAGSAHPSAHASCRSRIGPRLIVSRLGDTERHAFAWAHVHARSTRTPPTCPLLYPTEVVALAGHRVIHIATSGHHTAVCTDKGAVFTFGSNEYGARGRSTDTGWPAHVTADELNGARAVELRTDIHHTVVVFGEHGTCHILGLRAM
jgi:hypothetical protein